MSHCTTCNGAYTNANCQRCKDYVPPTTYDLFNVFGAPVGSLTEGSNTIVPGTGYDIQNPTITNHMVRGYGYCSSCGQDHSGRCKT